MKKHILLISVIGILACGIFYFFNSISFLSFLQKGGHTGITAEFQEYRKIDKLFTAFAYVPIVDYKKGYLKREVLKNFFTGEEKEPTAVKGYCLREYDVGIGYDRITDELLSQYKDVVCQKKKFDELPPPQILSINPVSSDSYGEYSRKDCDDYDRGEGSERKSYSEIMSQLNKSKQWDMIVENSQKILMNFLQIYCEL